MAEWQRNGCAIVGIGESETYSRSSGKTELALAVEAIRAAIADAGIAAGEVDGVIAYEMDESAWPGWLASSLGIQRLNYWGRADHGGNASCGIVAQAVAAITAGLAHTVVCYRSLNGRSGRRFGLANREGASGGNGEPERVGGTKDFFEYAHPFGLAAPGQVYGLLTQRHMYQYGTTSEQLGAIAVVCRENANRNPHAQMYGRPLDLEDHQNSRLIAAPLRLFDYCLETDGACAVVVTDAARAKDLPKPPAYIRAATQGLNAGRHGPLFAYPVSSDDPLVTCGKYTADRLYSMAGLGPDEIRVVQFYDCFTPTVLLQIEDYGFCAKGEGGPFVEGGANIRPGGRVAVNTAGGNLSEGYIHGLNHVVEGVRQIRGTSTTQVEDSDICLVTGGLPVETSALILDRNA